MGALLNLKIGTRLSMGFSAILLALVGMSVLAIVQLSSMASRVELISEFGLGQQIQLHAVTSSIGTRGVAARNLVLDVDAARNNEQITLIKQMSADVEKGVKALESSFGRDTSSGVPEMRKILADLRAVEGRYVPITIAIAEAVLAGKRAEATEKLLKECQPTLTEIMGLSDRLGKAVEHAASERVALAVSAYEQSRMLTIVLAVVVVAIGIAVSMVLTRSITQPIDKALQIARTVAAGDLTSRIEVNQNDETGHLLQALKAMNENLSRVVSEVRSASDAIAIGTGQIASGNADLSSRTESQASNLEETAASMEELNATVRNNADTASQAAQLASSASTAARRGGDAVGQVVSTMDEISSSSRKVVEIIAVIDGIAFQTNILALNAAVEAARAGEQGRGFAVVAGEVRVLAQRSAAAAKEIKQLIAASAERVDEGARLVGEAGSAMEDILTQVQRVNDLIDGINAATTEQTAGIGQVNAAVAQLDQVTQQNAALVEESAAAAESLRQQARQLVDAVGAFRTSGDGSGSSASSSMRAASPAPAPAPRAAPRAKAASSPPPAAPRAQPKPAMQTAGGEGDWDTF